MSTLHSTHTNRALESIGKETESGGREAVEQIDNCDEQVEALFGRTGALQDILSDTEVEDSSPVPVSLSSCVSKIDLLHFLINCLTDQSFNFHIIIASSLIHSSCC